MAAERTCWSRAQASDFLAHPAATGQSRPAARTEHPQKFAGHADRGGASRSALTARGSSADPNAADRKDGTWP